MELRSNLAVIYYGSRKGNLILWRKICPLTGSHCEVLSHVFVLYYYATALTRTTVIMSAIVPATQFAIKPPLTLLKRAWLKFPRRQVKSHLCDFVFTHWFKRRERPFIFACFQSAAFAMLINANSTSVELGVIKCG